MAISAARIAELRRLLAVVAEPEPKHRRDIPSDQCPGCIWQSQRRRLQAEAVVALPDLLDIIGDGHG